MKVSLSKIISMILILAFSNSAISDTVDFDSIISENESSQNVFYKNMKFEKEPVVEFVAAEQRSVELKDLKAINIQGEIEIVDVRREIASAKKRLKLSRLQNSKKNSEAELNELKLDIPERSQDNFSIVLKKNGKTSKL